VQKLNDLGAQAMYVQKIQDFKWLRICRCEARMYVQILKGLRKHGEAGGVYVQNLKELDGD